MSDHGTASLEGVAIVGMFGRFPGADSVDELWTNLCGGVESITRFGPDELDPSVPRRLREDPDYVPVRGVLRNADAFDAGLFGISPREAELMDPQARVFLEASWAALESAGYDPGRYDGMIAVYAGMANNTYYSTSVLARPDLVNRFGSFQVMLANEKDFLATRVAHKLDLKGPAVSLYTGCSTSLVAVSHAFHSLMSYQCDMALAGGVCITCPQETGYRFHEGGIEARDGSCRPFSADASGTVFSNGVGIVVLKRLDEAVQDGDHIHAVLLGAALNNDGAAKVSFAAPSVAGQADVIATALGQGDVDPSTLGYVEAHGTATQLGDPVEFEGLKRAFQYPRSGTQFCALGSVKSNFGHLLAAAGVTGLIKATLALEREIIPPTINFSRPNPKIDFERSPFFLNTEAVEWPRGSQPRRAGVSSFGIGGTNAHVVLQEAPPRREVAPDERPHLLVLSAKSPEALDEASSALAAHLDAHPELALADVAYTLQAGRRELPQRRIVVCSGRASAPTDLRGGRARWTANGECEASDPDVVFVFPGHGSQYPGMGRELYAGDTTFRATMDRCADVLAGLGYPDLLASLRGDADDDADDPLGAHCRVFATELALADTWRAWGVMPKALVGHSLGEWVAACVAGVFSPEDGLRLVYEHGRLLRDATPGGMTAVRLPAEEVAALAPEGITLAADNAPSLSVVAGAEPALQAFESVLTENDAPHRRLPSSRAFHSPALEGTVDGLLEVVGEVRLSRPRIPWVSTVHGGWIDPHEATDPVYWARHHLQPVRFRQAMERILEDPSRVVLEVGAGTTLATCARQIGAARDWAEMHTDGGRRIPLPTYPFARTRFWLPAASGRLEYIADADAKPMPEESS